MIVRLVRLPRIALAVAAVPFLAAGCVDSFLVQRLIQAQIDPVWTNPSLNAQIESRLESDLAATLDRSLLGREIEVTGPNPLIEDVRNVDVELGSRAPALTVSNVRCWTTSLNQYMLFDWSIAWPSGNGASLRFYLQLAIDTWLGRCDWCYPDLDVTIQDLSATASGTVLVVKPSGNGLASDPTVLTRTLGASAPSEQAPEELALSNAPRASVTVTSASVNFSASGQGNIAWIFGFGVDLTEPLRTWVSANIVTSVLDRAIAINLSDLATLMGG